MSPELDLHHLAAAYALDALDADERVAFEAHYHDCDVCSHDVGDFRSTLAALGELTIASPPPALKALVMQQVATTRQLSPRVAARSVARQTLRRPWLFAAAASLLIAVAATAFLVGRQAQPDDTFAAQLEQVMAQPDVQIVDLTATSGSTEGRVRVAWSATAQEVAVIADGLSSPGDDTVYELWLIADSGAVPMAMLDGAENGEVRQILTTSERPLSWGVTLEPVTGSTAPTGEILFHGDA